MRRSYSKNKSHKIDGLQDKIKLLNIIYKIIVFRNVILNNYLIHISFKSIYYHLYK